MSRPAQKSYGQILKSSVLIGSSSAVDIALRIIRTKVLAVLLGPNGIGLLGIYGSITDLVQSVAGLGVNTSGVRQIAEAVGAGDTLRIGRTVAALRRIAPILGGVGAAVLVIFSGPIAHLSFGDDRHALPVALLGVVVLFGGISAAQISLVQGMRRIGDLARISVLGSLYGTLLSIPIVYFFGEQGIVPFLICVAAMAIITSWWYARKVKVPVVAITTRQFRDESVVLLKLGSVFMASAFMLMGTAYLIRLIVLRQMGIEATGLYQAAWALGGLYAGFILNAMAADFYPSLTAVAHNHPECNRLVNEQTEVGLLLAGPGVLGTLTFAQVVIELCYSAKFQPAVEILRWICLGMVLRVTSWPMGFILRAKGRAGPIFWSELLKSLVNIAAVWFCVLYFGLRGTGIAFFLSYLFYWLMIYAVARRTSEFRWSGENKRLGLLYIVLVSVMFFGWYVLPAAAILVLGTVITAFASIQALKRLCALDSLGWLPKRVRSLLVFLRLLPAGAA